MPIIEEKNVWPYRFARIFHDSKSGTYTLSTTRRYNGTDPHMIATKNKKDNFKRRHLSQSTSN